MEFITSLFLFGTIWFWLFWAIVTIAVITSLETEKYFLGNVFAVGALAVIYDNIAKATDPITVKAILIFVGLYLLAGAIWSLFKWWRHCKEAVSYANEQIGDGKADKDYDWIHRDLANKMSASNNKAHITAWIAYWPWSFLWNISRDIINTIFDWLTGLYNGISKSVLSQLKPIDPTLKK